MTEERAESSTFHLLTSELIAGGFGLRFQARGRSMLPTIQDGEIVHVKPVASHAFRIGDIVLLRSGAQFKAHRIIGKRGDGFVIRGDAGLDSDGEIRCDRILGKVIAKESINPRRLVRLDSMRSRISFFAYEARRQVAMFLTPR